MCANELSEEVFGACFDVATANKNEIKGTLIKDAILLGGTVITIAVASLIFTFRVPSWGIAMLGAGIITGPTTLVASLCANYYAEDYCDDGQGNHSVNDAVQWQNIGTAALIDYGGEMIGVVCQLSPTVDGAYTVVEYTVKISQIKNQGNDHYSSQKNCFRTPSGMNKLAVPTYLIR